MILKISSLFCQILFQASIPLLLYSLICCIEATLPLWSSEYFDSPWIQAIKDFLLRFYANYPLFVIAVLLLNSIIDLIKKPREAAETSKDHGRITQFLRNCFCLTLIYACFQLLPFSIISPLAQQKSHEDVNIINGLKEFPRILEEREEQYLRRDNSYPKERSKNEYFQVGEILGSLPIGGVHAMVISKDGKTVFQSGISLRIIDISDNHNPRTLSTLALKDSRNYKRALLLSADEKYLYLTVGASLEIFDIANLKSPISLSSIIDTDLEKLQKDPYRSALFTSFIIRHSMALSWDQKTLYVGGEAFQIFSVEDPRQPQLILSTAKYIPRLSVGFKFVAASHDSRILYVANGTIEVYNISMNPNEPVLESEWRGEVVARSLLLGRDNKTLYAAGLAQNETILIEKLLIQKNSAELKSLETFNLGATGAPWPQLLDMSLSGNTIFLINVEMASQTFQTFGAYNMRTRQVLDLPSNLLSKKTLALRAIPKTNNFIVSTDEQWNLVSFSFNYPNPRAFSLPNKTLGVYRAPKTGDYWASGGSITFAMPSSLGIDRVYFLYKWGSWRETEIHFTIVDLTNKNETRTLGSYLMNTSAHSFQISERAKRAYVFDKESMVHILDFSNFSSIQKIGVFNLTNENEDERNYEFIVLDDGKTVLTYFTYRSREATNIKIIDFSDPSSTKLISEGQLDEDLYDFDGAEVQVSSQGIMFMCLSDEFFVYNISSFEALFSSEFEEGEKRMKCTLFEEKGLFFLETQNRKGTYHSLTIINISDITSPELLTTLLLPKQKQPTAISSDASKAYAFDADCSNLLVIDLSDPESPTVLGQIPFGESMSLGENFFLSGDNKFAYVRIPDSYSSGRPGVIYMRDLQMKYILNLKNDNFALGKKYTLDLPLLQLNKEPYHQPFANSNYKIIKLSFSQISLKGAKYQAQTNFTPLPEWINFDKENSLLNIESKKERDVGNYTFYVAYSLKVPFEAFNFIGNRTQAEDLVAALVSLGFLDNQRFLTPAFRNEEDFMIQSYYSVNKSKIYNTLKEYYFETFNPLRLLPSLDLKVDSGFLSILTPSLDVIKVDIKLKEISDPGKRNSQPQFLSKAYGSLIPSITEYKKHFRIEGRLSEVNNALKNLVVSNTSLACDGEIIVTDNLNPPLEINMENIVKYFTSNTPPKVNLDVQSQIDEVPIYTGEFMIILLNHSTFTDENLENLNYRLVMNTPERLEKPAWIGFDNNLVLKGTAPEEFFSREIKLLLIAENEFEKVEVPLTLEIKLSPVYLMKILVRFSPYILTIIGLYIKANKIYNIVFRKWFKHPKEFVLEIGREVEISPVWFISEEKKESELILNKLCLKIAKDLGCSAYSQEELVDYFWNLESGEPDAEKLRRVIEETVDEIDPKKLKLFLSEVKSRAPLIYQMIENQFVLWKLDSKQEKATKEMFNKIKGFWIDIVKWDKLNSQFRIKEDKFDEILESFGEISSKEDIHLTQITRESLLSKDSEINVDLLKKALRILAFKNYCLNEKAIDVYIKVKQIEQANCLKKLLRRDLKEVSFSENRKKVYGIKYKIDKGRLELTGIPDQELEGETLVIQISNRHERILKEFWIRGVPSGERGESFLIHNKSGYEVF